MFESMSQVFDNSGFMPHGHCFLWTPALLWSYVVSDLMIAGSYFSIPVAIWYFAEKRPDLPFKWIFVMFGIFVMACGSTHLYSIWNVWHAEYWGEAGIKVVTAAASVITAILLWPLIPRALAIPSHQQLAHANENLQREVERRTLAELALRQRNNELEQRSAQLEAANRDLQSFSYSVSHDLRAPLRAIHGFAEILVRRHRDGMNEQGRHYLDNIVKAGADMGVLIDDLLRYSRLGRTAVQRHAVDLNRLLEQIGRTLEARTAEIGAELVIPARLPEIQGDRTLLEQILTNLLVNAYTYRRRDVKPRVEFYCREETEHWILCVADNGIGIDRDQFDRIFIVFQRLHGPDEYPGTGIGLALVRKAAQLLGGEVWVESEVGRGSTFCVRLPKVPRVPAPQAGLDISWEAT